MKWIIIILAVTLSLNANASRFKGKDGNYIVRGDTATKLFLAAGEPVRKRSERVCLDKKRDYCKRWSRTEYWYYQDRDESSVIWTIKIVDDKVVEFTWSR